MAKLNSSQKKIKAVVLTYDNNRPATLHVIKQYEKLWPENPFIFQIPFQSNPIPDTANVNSIKTPKAIKATVLTLIKDMPDDEWIYWCIDDKYPEQLKKQFLNKIFNAIICPDDRRFDGVLFSSRHLSHPFSLLNNKNIMKIGGLRLQLRHDTGNLWLHQFIRAGVLRSIFNQLPDHIPSAKLMDDLKKSIVIDPKYRLYRTTTNLGFYGESMSAGKLTRNCFESMKKSEISFGELKTNFNQYYFIGYPLYLKMKKEYWIYFAKMLYWNLRK